MRTFDWAVVDPTIRGRARMLGLFCNEILCTGIRAGEKGTHLLESLVTRPMFQDFWTLSNFRLHSFDQFSLILQMLNSC